MRENPFACSSRLRVVLFALFAAPLACSKGEPPAPATSPSVSLLPPPTLPPLVVSTSEPSPGSIHAASMKVAVGPMRAVPKTEIPASVRFHGEVEHAVRWTDKNGDNLAVFTRGATSGPRGGTASSSAYLDVQHVIFSSPARPKVLRSLTERVDQCDGTLVLSFLDAAFGVTDLDHDGIGELTFAYARACRTDASPTALKLLMLENGDKYILRGTMRDGLGHGGEFRVDPSFARGAPPFVEHARRSWQSVSTS